MMDEKLTKKIARQTNEPHYLIEYESGKRKIMPVSGLALDPDKVKVLYYASPR